MKVITLMNEKGGVGKTTLCGTLAVGLALKGYRVLAIDADGQGNLTSWMQLAKNGGFYDLCVRDHVDWRSIFQAVPGDAVGDAAGRLFCVGSNFETSGIAITRRLRDLVTTISSRFERIKQVFDYVVIDTQPNPTPLHDALSFVTDYLIYPTECESFSAWEGLPDSLSHTDRNRQVALESGLNKARPIGIVPNKFRANTALHEHFLESLRNRYGDLVWTPIPLRTSIAEQQLVKENLLAMAPDMNTSGILWNFVDETINAMARAEREQA